MSQLASALGERFAQMGMMTFAMVTSQDKGSKMALVAFFNLLPFLLLSPFFGVLVDRCSRKNLMIFTDILRAVLVLFIPIVWMSTPSVILIFCWSFVLGCLAALFTPAKLSLMANITDKNTLLGANSLMMATSIGATLFGTLFSGAVIRVIGTGAVFAVNGLTYAISAFFISRIVYERSSQVAGDESKNIRATFIDDVKVSLGYIHQNRFIVRLMLLSSIFSFVSSFAYILILNYGSLVLKQDSFGLGVLLFCAGLGMISGSLIMLKRREYLDYVQALYLSYFIVGFFYAVFFFRPPFYMTLAILLCTGVGVSILTIVLDTIFQQVIPDELKGKVFAVRGVLTSAVFLSGLLLAGFLIRFVPASALFAATGLVGIWVSTSMFIKGRRWKYEYAAS